VPHSAIIEVFITKMTTPSVEDIANENKIKSKGKHASSTENRRMVWEKVVWPLILEVNRSYFTLREYHVKRNEFCNLYNIRPSKVAGGFVSLLIKGILIREKNIYSIHYRLIPYMRKKVSLEYGLVIREVNTKR
jgi:hypothetical protein